MDIACFPQPAGVAGAAPAVCHHGLVLTFACPRCATDVEDEFYGPCLACRTALRNEQGRVPIGTVSETAYEPKMNVTPNAVATKD